MKRRTLTAAVLLVAVLSMTAPAAELGKVIEQVRGAVRPEEAMDRMRRVYSTDRWSTFPKFQETAEYIKTALTGIGLKDVEIVAVPADGVTQFGYWTEPLAWDARSARLELLDPEAPEDIRVLADYQKVPASLGMWSGPTPPEGVVAEVVEYSEKADLRGKLALTAGNPAELKSILAKKGALGAINAFTENPQLENGRQWINSWGDNGWAFTKTSTPLLSYSITPRQAAYLRKQLSANKTVRVRATADTRYYAGSYPYVTGIVPGDGPEEVLTLGHAFEQGANDNASGVAAQIESLATLQRLIASGALPRPKRSIRVLIMGEMYGSMAYLAHNPERVRRTVAAMCVDTPAAAYELKGTEYTFYLSPHSGKSYVDAFVLRVAEEYFPKVGRPWHERPFRTGTDSYLSEPMVGIPTAWPYSGSGVQTHHNSEDTPDRVDPRSLRDLAIVNAAYLYYLATAGETEARWLAELTQKRGLSMMEDLGKRWIAGLGKTPGGDERRDFLYAGLESLQYAAERETAAVLSARRLSAGVAVDDLTAGLTAGAKEISQRLTAAAKVKPQRPEEDFDMGKARKVIVKRNRFGTIPLDELAPDQREGYPSGVWRAALAVALYWCDGQRNLAEVIRLTRLELGAAQAQFDFLGYFRFLQKRGYVELR